MTATCPKELTMRTEPYSEEQGDEARHYEINVAYVPKEAIYLATMPELNDLRSHGDTPQEAVEEVVIAAAGILEHYRQFGIPIPAPKSMMAVR
jgi:predicted RNase H-like HicB family nuclease